ncbi:hypothetical protein [Catelliglobosispora koreensis]|uniref:hypothetical protein n=1 Tax=Catelliglobosispora koreensis TaxID=129052 RepID=UPI0012F9DADD|nr:hypothetical protein [Catelliglobosispora koreensis]
MTTAIITGAAGNIAANLVSGHVDSLRQWIGKAFGSGSDMPLQALQDDLAALRAQLRSDRDVQVRWVMLLTRLLHTSPNARPFIEEMARQPAASNLHIGSQTNNGSGTFVGGNNYGPITVPSSQGA